VHLGHMLRALLRNREWTGLKTVTCARLRHTTHKQDLPMMPGSVNFRQLFSAPWHRYLLSKITCMLSTCHLAVHNFVHPPDQEVTKTFKSHKGEILHNMVAEWNKGVQVQEFSSATKQWKSLIKMLIHGWHNLWPSGSFTARNVSKF